MNKKGQGLSVETVILIVIGVLVLVFLIIGFTMGWAKIFPFINPPNNVKDISDKCGYACQTDDKYNYCTANRDVSVENEITVQYANNENIVFGKKIAGSCYEISAIAALGMPACISIACGNDASPYVYRNENFAKVACLGMKTGLTSEKKLEFLDSAGKQSTAPLSCTPAK